MNGSIAPSRFTVATLRMRSATVSGIIVRGALPALAGALLLAGCGGGTSGTSAAGASASATASAGLSTFQTCLKQHGVTITPRPSGARPTGSFSPGAFPTGSARPRPSSTGADSTALKACEKYAPAGFGGGANRTVSSSALTAFKSCLSSNGVKVTGSTASAILSQLRNATGKTATAARTCEVLLQSTAPTPTPSA
jgi:hypothetical protein